MLAMSELKMSDQITETKVMSPIIMVVIGASVFAAFWKHKPHNKVKKISKI